MKLEDLLKNALERGVSDLHITVGIPPVVRKNGKLVRIGEERMEPEETREYVGQIVGEEHMDVFDRKGELDVSYSLPGIGRFRVNIFKQRGTFGLAFRMVNLKVPKMEELELPSTLKELARKTRGLILVTGPTGSGKTTTLASMIDKINEERECHILTLEEPIEYLHKHKKSMVNQREVGSDSSSYATALKAALREDPDVILVGELSDLDTIETALKAAETGHLVLSTLYTVGAANTIDRIIEVFPPHQQQHVRIQLSMVLQAVVSQQLLTRADQPGQVSAVEMMTVNSAVRKLIRENKTNEITSFIYLGLKYGMQSMEGSLLELYQRGMISREDAITSAINQEYMLRILDN